MDEEKQQQLLVEIQKSFPICPRPYEALGQALGCSEQEVMGRLRELKDQGILRQISAIFDSRALGYQSSLVAAKAEAGRIESAAMVVSAHPGVSHNYERKHGYNLWFTLAVPPEADLAAEVARLANVARLEHWLILPALRTFKIEVSLDSGAAVNAKAEPRAPKTSHAPVWLSEGDKEAVRWLQEDLELVPRPFLRIAEALNRTEDEVFDWMAEAGSSGVLRRFAGILRHRKAGFSANGMGVWNVPEERVEELGKLFASYKSVSHCYERPRGPEWPYNLFSMAHAKSPEECGALFKELSEKSGIEDYQVLFSTREFKKERVKYFLERAATLLWRSLERIKKV